MTSVSNKRQYGPVVLIDYSVGYLVIPSDTKDTMQCLHMKRLDPAVSVYLAPVAPLASSETACEVALY